MPLLLAELRTGKWAESFRPEKRVGFRTVGDGDAAAERQAPGEAGQVGLSWKHDSRKTNTLRLSAPTYLSTFLQEGKKRSGKWRSDIQTHQLLAHFIGISGNKRRKVTIKREINKH